MKSRLVLIGRNYLHIDWWQTYTLVKKWRLVQSTSKLFFPFILAVFLKMQCSLERVFFPPILQCCLVFCCKNKNNLRYDELFFQLRIEKCWPWNYHVMILTQGLHYMFLCKKNIRILMHFSLFWMHALRYIYSVHT